MYVHTSNILNMYVIVYKKFSHAEIMNHFLSMLFINFPLKLCHKSAINDTQAIYMEIP